MKTITVYAVYKYPNVKSDDKKFNYSLIEPKNFICKKEITVSKALSKVFILKYFNEDNFTIHYSNPFPDTILDTKLIGNNFFDKFYIDLLHIN